MGNVYIFRGKAASGKTTLADMLAKKLLIPRICKDDIVDALKTTPGIDKSLVNNTICYNILHKIIQTNLDIGVDMILDIALGDRNYAKAFFDNLDFKDNRVVWFFIVCSDEAEFRKRHEARLLNPLPHQSFRSYEHVVEHFKNTDFNPFEYDHVIDTAQPLEKSFEALEKIIADYGKKKL